MNKSRRKSRRPLLLPLNAIYGAVVAAKNSLYDAEHMYTQRLQWPVISVGSLSAGGAGKTPFTLLLAETLKRHGWQPDVLSRGYGRKSSGCAQVQVNGSAREFGDEPVLMAARGLDVFVANRRSDAGTLAESTLEATPRRLHLLDDGFQHRRLQRDINIVLLTAEDWADKLLPAGNLREPMVSLRRADAIVLREKDAALEPQLRQWLQENNFQPQLIRIRRTLAVVNTTPHPLLFCGIARPQDFSAMLQAAGHDVSRGMIAFRDHEPYTPAKIASLVSEAKRLQADGFITTEKDAMRLTPELRAELEKAGPLAVAVLQTRFCDEDAAMQWLLPQLAKLSESMKEQTR